MNIGNLNGLSREREAVLVLGEKCLIAVAAGGWSWVACLCEAGPVWFAFLSIDCVCGGVVRPNGAVHAGGGCSLGFGVGVFLP